MFIYALITTPTLSPQKSLILFPTRHQQFQDVFTKDKATSLPNYQPYDCPINLQPGKDLPLLLVLLNWDYGGP